jgi:hypothetical protein
LSAKIVFNGQEYDSVDEMPIEVRYAYQEVLNALEDKDHNGVPDVLEHGAQGVGPRVVMNTRIKLNGQEVKNMDELPAEVRVALGQINPGQNAASGSPAESWPPPSKPIIPIDQSPPKTSDKRLALALVVIVFLLLVIMGLAAYGALHFAR